MSRIGKQPIEIPTGVEIKIGADKVSVKGPKGSLEEAINEGILVKQEGTEIIVERKDESKRTRSNHGLVRSLIENMVIGVTEGYKKVLEINGIGYRAAKAGKKLTLTLGFSHPIEMQDPEGVEATVEDNKITVAGISKQKVGQYAADIRAKRKPEPYKGKGIKYIDEHIRRKSGKAGS